MATFHRQRIYVRRVTAEGKGSLGTFKIDWVKPALYKVTKGNKASA